MTPIASTSRCVGTAVAVGALASPEEKLKGSLVMDASTYRCDEFFEERYIA
jgi:hypothetical protein